MHECPKNVVCMNLVLRVSTERSPSKVCSIVVHEHFWQNTARQLYDLIPKLQQAPEEVPGTQSVRQDTAVISVWPAFPLPCRNISIKELSIVILREIMDFIQEACGPLFHSEISCARAHVCLDPLQAQKEVSPTMLHVEGSACYKVGRLLRDR